MNEHFDRLFEPADETLHAYLDGELDDARSRVFEARLAADPRLAARLQAFASQERSLRLLAGGRDVTASRDFRPDLQRRIVTRWAESRRRPRVWWAAAAAVTLLLAAGLAGWTLELGAPQGERSARGAAHPEKIVADAVPPAQRAAAQLIGFGAGVSTGELDKAIVEGEAPITWLTGQLVDYSLRKPELDALGLKYLGGKVLSSIHAPSIRLVYADAAGKHIFLYVGLPAAGSEASLAPAPEGYLSLVWRRGPLLFALVAPTDSAQLLEIVRLASEGVAATTPPAATDVVAPPAPSIVPTEPLAKNPVVVQEVASPEVQRGVMLMPVPRPPFAVETEPKPDLAQPKAL